MLEESDRDDYLNNLYTELESEESMSLSFILKCIALLNKKIETSSSGGGLTHSQIMTRTLGS